MTRKGDLNTRHDQGKIHLRSLIVSFIYIKVPGFTPFQLVAVIGRQPSSCTKHPITTRLDSEASQPIRHRVGWSLQKREWGKNNTGQVNISQATLMVLLSVRYFSPLLSQHGQERQPSGEFRYQMCGETMKVRRRSLVISQLS